MNVYHPCIVVISDYDQLSHKLVAELTAKNLKVLAVSELSEDWRSFSDKNNYLDYSRPNDLQDFSNLNPDYIIINNLTNSDSDFLEKNIALAKSISTEGSSKTLVACHVFQKAEDFEKIQSILEDLKKDNTFYCAVMAFPVIIKEFGLTALEYNYLLTRSAQTANNENIEIIGLDTAVDCLINSLFSMSSFKKTVYVSEEKIRLGIIKRKLGKVFKLPLKGSGKMRDDLNVDDKRISKRTRDSNLSDLISAIDKGFYEVSRESSRSGHLRNRLRLNNNRENNRKTDKSMHRFTRHVKGIFSAALNFKSFRRIESDTHTKKTSRFLSFKFLPIYSGAIILFLPYILVFASCLFTLFIFRAGGDEASASKRISVSFAKDMTSWNIHYIEQLNKLDFMEFFYRPAGNVAGDLFTLYDLMDSKIKLLDGVYAFYIFSAGRLQDNFDLKSNEVVQNLKSFYEKSAFFSAEMEGDNNLKRITKLSGLPANEYYKNFNAEQISLWNELPGIVAEDGIKTYLVVIQNNSQLKPAGGLITALGSLTFSGGRLEDIKFESIKKLDSLNTGRVEPPAALKKYGNIKSWTLSQANWEPDFNKTAEQIEWFLGKNENRKFDGVIALDNQAIKNMIDLSGNVEIDYGSQHLVISSENYQEFVSTLWESKAAGEAPDDLLLSFLDKLFSGLTMMNKKNFLLFLQASHSLLEQKNIQLYFNDGKIQSKVSDLGWDGGFNTTECDNNCYGDYIAPVDGNLSDTFINILPEFDLKISIEEGVVKRQLYLFLENPSGQEYISFMRVYTNRDSGYADIVRTSDDNKETEVNREIESGETVKNIGFLVNLKPYEKAVYRVAWESGTEDVLSGQGKYLLMFRKQAGQKPVPLTVEINLADSGEVATDPSFNLTNTNTLYYNTSLSADFVGKIVW